MQHFNQENYCQRDEKKTRKAKRGKDIKRVEKQKQTNHHHNNKKTNKQKDTERKMELMRL